MFGAEMKDRKQVVAVQLSAVINRKANTVGALALFGKPFGVTSGRLLSFRTFC